MEHSEWLSKDELILNRMVKFHSDRVVALATDAATLSRRDKGSLVVHLIPQQCIVGRIRFDAAKLKEHGSRISPLGDRGGRSRFNVDGLMNYDGHDELRAYSQIYRDKRLESVMSDAAYPLDRHQEDSPFVLRDIICEKAVRSLVSSYLTFCKAVEIEAPMWMFSALVDCRGVFLLTDRSFRDVSQHSIDRSPAYLPELEITALDAKIDSLLRPWCDSLWQACGLDRSYSYDDQGTWHERR